MFTTTLLTAIIAATPSSPYDIVFPEYVFTPPTASSFKETTRGGTVVFIAEDRELPLISVVATFRGGDYLVSSSRAGLVSMMASLVRSGGTQTMSAEEVDERFAFLAANSSVVGGGTTITATLNCLSNNFEDSFDLFLDMLQNPGFQESRILLEKNSAIESMKQRNDNPGDILNRENRSLLFGSSYLGRSSTISSIEGIDKQSLEEERAKIINPSNLILSISGDFNEGEMLGLLAEKFKNWEFGDVSTEPQGVSSKYIPGIYYVDQDVPQGGVRINIRSIKRGDKDVAAARLMNYILGGGGFSSRITQKVRSDEGLAYSAGSGFSPGVFGDGVWFAMYESKNSTVALAAKLIFDEIERIKTTLVSDEDLELAKNATIETLPSTFNSKSKTLSVFVSDELTDQDPLYWEKYRDKIRAVTKEDVMRVANRILKPEEMYMLIVGNWGEIEAGDADGRATMQDIHEIVGGSITELPILDPLTLELPGE
jgi:zinc protease